ncbi:hypothetical protein BDV95DRAFT_378846 [Massariosphaeria phaeospora]|uniref:Uncharacterized protein n=1 Tax=Massariosphaeria phaeospora TaxID=100035 RepID=A0A7C8IEM0_9PLEO|nr:hypothetical protein BDV95DRAFT_378846 [Massariosphaeria phaeospora]
MHSSMRAVQGVRTTIATAGLVSRISSTRPHYQRSAMALRDDISVDWGIFERKRVYDPASISRHIQRYFQVGAAEARRMACQYLDWRDAQRLNIGVHSLLKNSWNDREVRQAMTPVAKSPPGKRSYSTQDTRTADLKTDPYLHAMPLPFDWERFDQERGSSIFLSLEEVQDHFNVQGREAEEILCKYADWKEEKSHDIDVISLTKKSWNELETRQKMSDALDVRRNLEDLGHSGETTVDLKLAPAFSAPYFRPKELENVEGDFSACGPVLRTNLPIQVFERAMAWEQTRENSHPATPASGHHVITSPVANSPLGNRSYTTQATRAGSVKTDPFIPPELADFTTRFVHLGQPLATTNEDDILTAAPYACIGPLNDDGLITGIFSIPVDGQRGGEIADDCTESVVWEPKVRGVYYLGKDLQEAATREWILVEPRDRVDVIQLEDREDRENRGD